MPRSFLVKRRKSEDAKTVFDSEFTDDTKEDGLNHVIKQQTVVPCNQQVEIGPSSHLNLFERDQTVWNHSNTSCLHYTTAVLPHHSANGYVNLASGHACVKHSCCDYFHKKLEGKTGCLCCFSSTPKKLPDVTQHLKCTLPWCSGTNYDCGSHTIYFPKHEPFYQKSSLAPLKRAEFKENEVVQRVEKRPLCHVDKDERRSKTYLNVHKEETLLHHTSEKEDTVKTMDEIPAKKIRISITDIVDTEVKDDTGQISTTQKTTQLDIIKDKSTHDNEAGKVLVNHERIKKELSEPQNVHANNSEFCSGNVNSQGKHERKPMDVLQQNFPHKAVRKLQNSKSKKSNKDSIVKPYNTRVTTSRSRVYSSNFVSPEEEDDWKRDKEDYLMKGRQRSKLNRLLANEHERRRVAQLNNAYQDLRQLIPGYQCDTKLPKIKILKYAIDYIAHLDDILGAGSIQEV